MKWLQANMKYPKEAQDKGEQGRVIVQFIVEKDGSITEPKVARGVSPALDAEALRIVSIMPKWKPAKQRGQVVRVKYTIPVKSVRKKSACRIWWETHRNKQSAGWQNWISR